MNHSTPSPARCALAIAIALLAACSVTPDQPALGLNVPARFAEAEPGVFTPLKPAETPGQWRPAEPADQQAPSPWWEVLGDPVLMRLEQEALKANPDVSIAMARLQQARALTARSEAARVPSVDAGFGPTRQRTSGAADGDGDGAPGTSQTLWRAQATVAYEVDLFGRVAASVDAAQADAAQQQALAHQMLLLVQADVARTYFSLRQLEGERRLLGETVRLREDAQRLLQRRLDDGDVASFIVDQASTELFSTRAEQQAVELQYTLTAHALATLLGQAPATFSLAPAPLQAVTVRLPPGLPSSLLERRPDVAAAERAMAAENARIGVAKAAFFPALTLTGSLGYESQELGNLAHWSQRTFLLGPLVGTALNLPLFDGGRRDADLARARALYQQRVGEYRKAVLQAFREVEDGLASLRTLDLRIAHQRGAEQASTRVAGAAQSRFDEGDVDYLNVVDAQRTLLRNRQALIQAEGERARATVDLVRALGGGWSNANLDQPGNRG
ncbi:TPA: efflux transporter outer membrane subunit [Pseudomonas aeruginosa]|jgi:multidrug efflux system outer membrane protein|uniref:efflux transporter outer membrane subunit n=1 Tax=Pseudomonas TaxID=286 RepID=UPI0005B52095|nr:MULTISPECIES: efflux transporter outer membrane subunit [Pseudomonas]EIU4876314.1 efflux transporter outer membrane subunit [Pseudomonas aeruginosa]MBG5629139.1 efflux transporter outer membrane subunit [Pseudomonas aeruginosa]MBG6972515.1 efflux transporter outer membrane subunit [Pseudomonas aeruginosa]MBG7550740.1 efflux transporter outer membrane subunit [Pseudomonas aeruginosa]MCU9031570.1 efflux transporter outer membrane subunit [Pseudomonas aeruginosa]